MLELWKTNKQTNRQKMLSEVGQGEWGQKPLPGQLLGIPDCGISHSQSTKNTHSIHQIPAIFQHLALLTHTGSIYLIIINTACSSFQEYGIHLVVTA